jgi:hypothetical protein
MYPINFLPRETAKKIPCPGLEPGQGNALRSGTLQFCDPLLDVLQFVLEIGLLFFQGLDLILGGGPIAGTAGPKRAITKGPPTPTGATESAAAETPGAAAHAAAKPSSPTRAAGTQTPTGARTCSYWSCTIVTWHDIFLLNQKITREDAIFWK